MEKRFVERSVYSVGDVYVKTPCEVIAEGQNWMITKRTEFYDGKQEADKYYVEYNGKRAWAVFNNPIEAILNAISLVYGDEHKGKNVSQFHAFAYAMLEGMPSYE